MTPPWAQVALNATTPALRTPGLLGGHLRLKLSLDVQVRDKTLWRLILLLLGLLAGSQLR